ncbi:MAG: hypothetical protein WB492_05580 [Christiangramia sp.]
MKKMIFSALALALAITVTSCKNETSEENTEVIEETAAVETEANLEMDTEKVEDTLKVETEADSLKTPEVEVDQKDIQ